MHKYISAHCPIFLAVAGLVGCSHSGNAPDTRPIQLPADAQIAETVNGTAVPQSLLEAVARGHNLHLDKPEQREQALKTLTDMVLLSQAAQREDFFGDAQFRAEVEAARLRGVADAGVGQLERKMTVGDDVLQAQYDAEVARAGKFEFDFSQLLFANEDDALKAEGDLVAGKPFPQVFDAWRSKAKQAKVFTRVRLNQVPDALGKTLSDMKNGENTKVPVKTEFGWHVVHLDIANPFVPPAFDQVKEGIRRSTLLKMTQQRLETLREQAKVEYPPGTAPPAAKPAAPAPTAPEAPAAGK